MSAVAVRAASSFSERLSEFLERVEYRRLDNEDDREEAFRLRYEAYVREGIVPISFSRRLADAYDDAPNVSIFGTYIDGVMAGSIRIHVASPECATSPSLDVFPDVLGPEIEKGHTIVDPTRFVANPALACRYPELPYVTVRLGFLASEYFNADLGLASVRVEHQAFYKRLFGLRPLCEPRMFPNLTSLFSLMGINYLQVRDGIIGRYPFMRSTPEELRGLFDREEALDLPMPLPAAAEIAAVREYETA